MKSTKRKSRLRDFSFWLRIVKRCIKSGKNSKKVSIQLKTSAMNHIIGSNKINDGDKKTLNLKTLRNNSKLYSKRVPCVNASTTISQNAKKPTIVIIVKMTVFALVRSNGSIMRYAFKVNSRKSTMHIIQKIISKGFFSAK